MSINLKSVFHKAPFTAVCASLSLALYLGLGVTAPLSRATMGMDLYCGALPAPSAAQCFHGGQDLCICALSNSACLLDKAHKQLQEEQSVVVLSFTETSM